MVMVPHYGSDPKQQKESRFATAYTILFGLVIAMAALTWIIPSGQYDRPRPRLWRWPLHDLPHFT